MDLSLHSSGAPLWRAPYVKRRDSSPHSDGLDMKLAQPVNDIALIVAMTSYPLF